MQVTSEGPQVQVVNSIYAIGNYQDSVSRLEEVVFFRAPLVREGREFNPRWLGVEESCPEAYKVLECVRALFSQGIPLPYHRGISERLVYCEVQVMTHKLGSECQVLCVSGGMRGIQEGIPQIETQWESICVKRALSQVFHDGMSEVFEKTRSRVFSPESVCVVQLSCSHLEKKSNTNS
jgi:hypothetical protein